MRVTFGQIMPVAITMEHPHFITNRPVQKPMPSVAHAVGGARMLGDLLKNTDPLVEGADGFALERDEFVHWAKRQKETPALRSLAKFVAHTPGPVTFVVTDSRKDGRDVADLKAARQKGWSVATIFENVIAPKLMWQDSTPTAKFSIPSGPEPDDKYDTVALN